jgi:hypothetical protein
LAWLLLQMHLLLLPLLSGTHAALLHPFHSKRRYRKLVSRKGMNLHGAAAAGSA